MSTLYQRPTDLVGGAATVTVDTGSEDGTYPAANLVDELLYSPAKLTTKTGSWTLDFGSAQRVDVVALAYHNLDAGSTVKIQAHTSAAWGSPTINAAITIPGEDEDGHASMPWLDLTSAAGYWTGGFRYWRLLVSSTNSVNLSIGKLGLWSPKRTLVRGVSAGFTTSDEHKEIRHYTEYGVLHRYWLGVRRRTWVGQVGATDQDLDDLRAPALDPLATREQALDEVAAVLERTRAGLGAGLTDARIESEVLSCTLALVYYPVYACEVLATSSGTACVDAVTGAVLALRLGAAAPRAALMERQMLGIGGLLAGFASAALARAALFPPEILRTPDAGSFRARVFVGALALGIGAGVGIVRLVRRMERA